MKNLATIALLSSFAIFTHISAFGANIEGQNAPRANQGTNWSGGPLRGWYELEFIPCRVVLQPGSNQVVQINFNHTKNSSIVKRGIQNLFYFSPGTNVTMTTPVLVGDNSQEDWSYNFTANVAGNQSGYIYYFSRLSAGAHLFGGSSLDLYYSPLQIMKPGPSNGTPDLIISKQGPSTVYTGGTYTYSLTFSNSLAYTNTAIGVQLSDFLPAGTTYVPGSFQGNSLITNMTILNNQLWWDLKDLPPGANGTITYQVSIPIGFTNGSTIQNYAQIQCAQDDANELDNISIVTSTVVNSPPVAKGDMYTMNCNETLNVSGPGVLANDSDPAGFAMRSMLASGVSSGTLILYTNGSFTYTPVNNYAGPATFYYIATNGYTASAMAKVTINVLQLLAPPATNFSCTSSVPSPATNLTDYIAQGGTASGPYCDQPTTVTFIGDSSDGGSGCPASPLVITRTYKLTTGCGDTTNVVQTFTIIDTSVPVITSFPADATYSCAEQVPTADNALIGYSDNCSGTVTVSHDADAITAGSCANRYTMARTYRVSDSCGNVTSRTQQITIDDETAPTITAFPNDASYTCANAVPPANDNLVSAADNCTGPLTITHDEDIVTSSNCVNRLTITRTYRVTDACGNATSKTQTITVNGTIAPTIVTFPADATYTCADAVPAANDSVITATNACGGTSSLTVTHTSDVITSSNCVNRFTISRTYVATDACGNSSSKTQKITVNGTTAPIITAFPSDATYSCAGSVPSANDSLIAATNACGGVSGVTITHRSDLITSSNCVNRFTIRRTYIATDVCGNSSSKTQTITVNGTTPPTIVAFPADATYSCAGAVATANDSLVSATNSCGGNTGLTITHSGDIITSSNCVNRFTIARTYTATDACGNSTSKTQTITINATTPPTIVTFPADTTYSCAGAVPAANDSLVTATNACGGNAGLSITHGVDIVTSSNCVNRFTISRSYTATDACGNSTSKTQTITINGTTAPTIVAFPADATYSCAASVPAANESVVTATNSCGGSAGLTITHSADIVTSSNCVNRFTIRRTYIATDACGNSSSKTQTINVNGTTPPTIVAFPADATYSCAGAVPAANDSFVTATNGCGGNAGLAITHSADIVTSSNCVNRFTIIRSYTATDACGNSTSKIQTITVNGTTPPTIVTFPVDATYSCAGSVPAANDSLVTATNACGGNAALTITHAADIITSSNCVNRFTITRSYTATDACGNSTSKIQTITVNGTTPPTIVTFPVDATYSCVGSVPAANDGLVTATNSCGGNTGLTITHSADFVTSSNCVNRFTLTRTYRATDACGNFTTKNQIITVNGTTSPTITTFPADATYSCASVVPIANDSLIAATNACGSTSGLVITHNADVISSSNCVNHFTITRTYRVTDACGNSTTRNQSITVNGTTPPTITAFPQDTTYSCANAVPAANNSLVTAVDNCGATSVAITHDADVVTSSNCVNRFTIQRTYRVTDACGNATSKTQKITVNGTNAPTIATFPADATYSCANAVPPANNSLVTATDACGASSGLVITHANDVITASNCVNRFTISRTYIATDACGNSTSKTQKITINATTAPTITSFPANATYSCANAVPPANDTLVSATDGCGATGILITHATDVVTSSNCVNRFTITRTYTATDACGNSSSKIQLITVNGTTAPAITGFPNDATYSCADTVPSADDKLVSATDNCGATSTIAIRHLADVITSSNCVNRFTITRTYVVTDACGNSASKSQKITVNGTTAPAITGFPNDATYSCASAVPAPNDTLVTATDNCGASTTTIISHRADIVTSSNCVNRFTIRRTYVATDACGNSASRAQTITVNGTTAPTITGFPGDATYSCASAVPLANDTLVTATDNCGASSTVVITHAADLITSSNCVNRFTISRTYTATDACGNSTSKTQKITVNSTAVPTIASFPADATFSCASAVPNADDTLVTAVDGCGAVSSLTISHSDDVITSSNCVNRFVIIRTYVATDACGNSASKTQTITVDATTPPTITAFPADATFECSTLTPAADDTLVQATDNCGVSPVVITHDSDVVVSNICANHFTIERTYHATDSCGNATTRTQTITVNDTIAPIITCPAGFTVSHPDDIPGPNSENIEASDNCGAVTRSFLGETFVTNNNIVTITRTFAATDDCGNSSTCSQVIVMNPYLAQPTAQPDTYSMLENGTLTITAPGILANDSDPNSLPLEAILVSDTSDGILRLNPDGGFTYIPATYYVGADTFTYLPTNGGTNPGVPVTVTIDVQFVNQIPSFTKGPSQVVNNYDPPQTRLNWVSNISPGPANESAQTVQFLVSNANNAIFSSQPSVSPIGTLTFTPAKGRYGIATVSVAIKDNGGTANGGQDTSATQEFSIIVNNPPTVTINTPTNSSLFLYPSPIEIIATATDVDGTVTNVTFFSGETPIGQGTSIGNNQYKFTWTNAPANNSVLYALATDNYGATNLSPPVTIQLGNPVSAAAGPVVFSPSLYSWGQRISVTNPTISTVQSVTITFTSLQPFNTSILGVTGTNAFGQPYITFSTTIPPVSGIDNFATILYVAPSQPQVTFTTSASLSQGAGFTVYASTIVPITRRTVQSDGSFLLNFVSQKNRTYYVQYSHDMVTWYTSPIALKGNGTQLQWVDLGPNTTVSPPWTVPERFYRVVSP